MKSNAERKIDWKPEVAYLQTHGTPTDGQEATSDIRGALEGREKAEVAHCMKGEPATASKPAKPATNGKKMCKPAKSVFTSAALSVLSSDAS